MKRLFPFLQLHRAFPVDSLRVRWVPLFPSFQRLGAFAFSPHPGVPSFPGLRLLCPFRLLLGPWGFVWVSPLLLSTPLRIPEKDSRVHSVGLRQQFPVKSLRQICWTNGTLERCPCH